MTRQRSRRRAAGAPLVAIQAAPLSVTASPSDSAARNGTIDALRGVAIVAMIVYHFCFDLRFYHVTRADFEHDPFWLGYRALVVTSFLLLVGVSLVLAKQARKSSVHFWRRIGVLVTCAVAVSAASYLVFPASFIYFGILHAIAVGSVLAWPLAGRPSAAAVAGAIVIVAGLMWSHPLFDQRALSWIGFATGKPRTEDYVPLAPWLGVMLFGVTLGHIFIAYGLRALDLKVNGPHWLRWLGRHSLPVYLVHQPLLLGLLAVGLQR